MCYWLPPQSGGGLGINVAAGSPQSIPASVPSFASFAETPSSTLPPDLATPPPASNAAPLIEPGTLGALIEMQGTAQGTNSFVSSGAAPDASQSSAAPEPPPNPPSATELAPLGHANGSAPAAVISTTTTDVSVSSAPVAATGSTAGTVMDPWIDGLASAGGGSDLSQRIDGLWLKLLDS
jgi:hypothetical protein